AAPPATLLRPVLAIGGLARTRCALGAVVGLVVVGQVLAAFARRALGRVFLIGGALVAALALVMATAPASATAAAALAAAFAFIALFALAPAVALLDVFVLVVLGNVVVFDLFHDRFELRGECRPRARAGDAHL